MRNDVHRKTAGRLLSLGAFTHVPYLTLVSETGIKNMAMLLKRNVATAEPVDVEADPMADITAMTKEELRAALEQVLPVLLHAAVKTPSLSVLRDARRWDAYQACLRAGARCKHAPAQGAGG